MSEPFAEVKRHRKALGEFVSKAEIPSYANKTDDHVIVVAQGRDPIAVTVPLWMLRLLLTSYDVATARSKSVWRDAA